MNGANFVQASTLLQAIRGPIMLITLGALVAIDYAGVYGFWWTWPILIIVFGLLKLLERSGTKPAPYTPEHSGEYTSDRPPGGNVI
jgi:hypothetical protein